MKSMIEKGTLMISILKLENMRLSSVTLKVKKFTDSGFNLFSYSSITCSLI